jgi:hypothetical protein
MIKLTFNNYIGLYIVLHIPGRVHRSFRKLFPAYRIKSWLLQQYIEHLIGDMSLSIELEEIIT